MNCEQLVDKFDDLMDGSLDAADMKALSTHTEGCERCQQMVSRETALRNLLQEYGDSNVPTPTATYFDEALVTAARTGRKQQQNRSWLKGFGSALAAGLAIWFFSGAFVQAPVGPGTDSGIPVITMAVEEARTVNLVFSSAVALDNATLTVNLPQGIEIAGFAGQQEITWQTSLSVGKNLLPLQLIATMPTDATLLATLKHGEDDRTFRLRVDVS